jgi:hypothetical protein
MNFDNAIVQIVRSVAQRWLYLQWDRLRNGRRLPLIDEVDLDGRVHDAGELLFCLIETEKDKPRYRVLCEGAQVAAAYDADWTGRYLDEVFPDYIKASALDAYDHCRKHACGSVIDAAGKIVDCERLLLPFGSSAAVTHIVTSMQLISVAAAFMRQHILGREPRPVDWSVTALIGQGK